jgi:2-succinyl-6-hydroxy-2,4-cyclohexadiene-1-carboxylate synthase
MLATSSFGDINNQALIFFHGFLGSKEDWQDVVHYLKNDYFCLCIDLAGHGDSSNFITMDDLVSCIQSLPLKNPVAIGYSMGGRILKKLHTLKPHLFFSLFFLSSHPGLDSEKKREERSYFEKIWIQKIESLSIDDLIQQWYQQPIFHSLQRNKLFYEKIKPRREKQNKEGILLLFKEHLLSQQPMYSEFVCPATFFFGEYDEKYQELYLKKNWNVRIEKISQSGHCIHIENPFECATKIYEQLQREALS